MAPLGAILRDRRAAVAGRVRDLLGNAERQAAALMNHSLITEDAASTPAPAAAKSPLPEKEILDGFGSANTADGPLPPRDIEIVDAGIK